MPIDKLTKARAQLIINQPFFGSIALRMKFAEDEKVKKTKSNGLTIRYNPQMLDDKDVNQLEIQSIMAEQAMHYALLHPWRRGHREIAKWNKACDLAVAPYLEACNYQVAPEAKNWRMYGNEPLSAEAYYELIQKGAGDDDGTSDGNDGEGEGQGQSEGQNEGDDSRSSVEDAPTQGQNAGSEQEAKMTVAEAMHAAKQQGKLPGDLEKLLHEVLEPKIPWREHLANFARSRAKSQVTWTRPNRRFIADDLYLPTRGGYSIKCGVLCLDVSGSVIDNEIDAFLAEMMNIASVVTIERLIVLQVDSKIQHIVDCPGSEFEPPPIKGRGGTSFYPPFEYLEEHGIKPDFLIYLTDGYGDAPPEPDYPCMWLINNRQVRAPFGVHLVLDL